MGGSRYLREWINFGWMVFVIGNPSDFIGLERWYCCHDRCVQRVHSSPSTRLSACSDSLCAAVSDKFPLFQPRKTTNKEQRTKYSTSIQRSCIPTERLKFSAILDSLRSDPAIYYCNTSFSQWRSNKARLELFNAKYTAQFQVSALWELPTCFHLILNYISRFVKVYTN